MEVDISAALQALAPKLGSETVSDVQRLSAGASMETWAFVTEGASGRREMILRRRPGPFDEDASRSTSLATEAALITAAEKAGAPVAPLIRLCQPEDGLGEAHITARIAGETGQNWPVSAAGSWRRSTAFRPPRFH